MWTERRAESADNYAGVLVALEDAHLHSYSHRLRHRTNCHPTSDDDLTAEEDIVKMDGDDEGTAMLDMSVPEYSIEGLRREVRKGGRSEKWTSYECE